MNYLKNMTDLPTNLTELQSDYAVFLPALSTFYALFVGRQRRGLLPYDENIKGSGVPYIPHDKSRHIYLMVLKA